MFASRGERGEPCGMPRRLSRASVVRVFRPCSSVSSTGQSSHILIRCSTRRSTIRRATDFKSSAPPAEGRPILLRAYAEAKPATAKQAKLQRPSEWVLVFDCETTVDETQRLRFGTFQLWDGDKLEIQGLFFDPRPGSTTEAEQAVLKSEEIG